MFTVPRNFICLPVPFHFGHLFSCSPEINVILLFPHILGGSKQTVLLVYVPWTSARFYESLYIATKEGWTCHLSDFPLILTYDVFCRINKGYKTHFPLKTKWLPWQRIVNFGNLWPKIDHRKLDFLCFWCGLLCSWQRDVKDFNIMLGRAVLCVIFKPKIMSSLIKISAVIHALYHWGLELRHSCKKCENGRSSMQNKS